MVYIQWEDRSERRIDLHIFRDEVDYYIYIPLIDYGSSFDIRPLVYFPCLWNELQDPSLSTSNNNILNTALKSCFL
jgi:hypothetical protein